MLQDSLNIQDLISELRLGTVRIWCFNGWGKLDHPDYAESLGLNLLSMDALGGFKLYPNYPKTNHWRCIFRTARCKALGFANLVAHSVPCALAVKLRFESS